MAKDIHGSPFTEGTQCKLELYRMYLRESIPLFLARGNIGSITICDFFAGPGYDSEGNKGSPFLAIDTISELLQDVRLPGREKRFRFIFNDASPEKAEKLRGNLKSAAALNSNFTFEVYNEPFQTCFFNNVHKLRLARNANIVFIDQYGIKEVTQLIFEQLTGLYNTDFLFFLASASANRFKDMDSIWGNLPPLSEEEKQRINGKNVHRVISEKYRQWIPASRNFYLGSFSILKHSNVYGLVFGSGHPFGLEKFLDIAWKRSAEFGGEANFDIDGDRIDLRQPSLFPEDNIPTKTKEFNKILARKILSNDLISNHDVYIFTLYMGMLPRHARELVQELVGKGLIPNQSLRISRKAYKLPAQRIMLFQENGNERHLPTEGSGP
jgi:three-Cys-motif partner protein